MQDVLAAISTVGFPIICCLGLAVYICKQLENFRKTIENNTLALTALLNYLIKKDGD